MQENKKNQKNEVVKTEKPYYDIDLKIVLFKNDKRKNEDGSEKADPDYSGIIEVEKTELCRVVFWRSQGAAYLYLNGYMQNFADKDIEDFKTVIRVDFAKKENGKSPNIKGKIMLNDGHEYNVFLWHNPENDGKKEYYSGFIKFNTGQTYIEGGVI